MIGILEQTSPQTTAHGCCQSMQYINTLSAEHTAHQDTAAARCCQGKPPADMYCTQDLCCTKRQQKTRTSSSQHVVGVCKAGEGTLVGGHTNILKDEGTVQEEEVVGVWGEGR